MNETKTDLASKTKKGFSETKKGSSETKRNGGGGGGGGERGGSWHVGVM